MPQFDRFGSTMLLKRMEKLATIKDSPAFGRLREQVRVRVIAGNRTGLLAGTDGQGKPLVPVQPRKGKYKNASGPPLVPFRENSRFIRNFRAAWVQQAGVWHLLMGWEDITSVKGYPFVVAHLQGVPSRHLPRRPANGIRPRDRAAIQSMYKDLLPDILKTTA